MRNEHGLDREIDQSSTQITIRQWNQVLIKLKRLASNRILVTKTSELLHPSDFVTLANWAYQIDKPNTTPNDQATSEP